MQVQIAPFTFLQLILNSHYKNPAASSQCGLMLLITDENHKARESLHFQVHCIALAYLDHIKHCLLNTQFQAKLQGVFLLPIVQLIKDIQDLMHCNFQRPRNFRYIFILKGKYNILLQFLSVSQNLFPMQLPQGQHNEVVKLPIETRHET